MTRTMLKPKIPRATIADPGPHRAGSISTDPDSAVSTPPTPQEA